MLRSVTLVVLSLTLLGCVDCCIVRCDLETCDVVPAFTRFASGIFNADLADRNGTVLGGIELRVVEKADTNCFRAVFTTVENVGLAQLRVGIFSSADESPPTGRDRFTRRRDVRFPRTTDVSGTEITTLRKGRIGICPEDISVEESKSCCGESLFDLYAYAVVLMNGTRVRAYMKRVEGSTVPCRVPDPTKPFREVCTLQATCDNGINCSTDECLLGEDCVLLDEFSEANCAADSIAVADTQNRQCTCKKLDCGTEANCIADRACTDVTTFGESCPQHFMGSVHAKALARMSNAWILGLLRLSPVYQSTELLTTFAKGGIARDFKLMLFDRETGLVPYVPLTFLAFACSEKTAFCLTNFPKQTAQLIRLLLRTPRTGNVPVRNLTVAQKRIALQIVPARMSRHLVNHVLSTSLGRTKMGSVHAKALARMSNAWILGLLRLSPVYQSTELLTTFAKGGIARDFKLMLFDRETGLVPYVPLTFLVFACSEKTAFCLTNFPKQTAQLIRLLLRTPRTGNVPVRNLTVAQKRIALQIVPARMSRHLVNHVLSTSLGRTKMGSVHAKALARMSNAWILGLLRLSPVYQSTELLTTFAKGGIARDFKLMLFDRETGLVPYVPLTFLVFACSEKTAFCLTNFPKQTAQLIRLLLRTPRTGNVPVRNLTVAQKRIALQIVPARMSRHLVNHVLSTSLGRTKMGSVHAKALARMSNAWILGLLRLSPVYQSTELLTTFAKGGIARDFKLYV
ncbi:hypothetical protein NDN08_000282 [Rhodosorus marinus]|uniref:Uncharacterized protein n=1 Tax=Rhodosorus marinus TaxID=101924 RepID=A0AAV8UER6_9RHOD|nr:hypothetical protein NDN08_000282 [Rhodosorus marinus]